MPGIKYITRVLRGVRFEKLNYVMGVVKQKSGHSKARTILRHSLVRGALRRRVL